MSNVDRLIRKRGKAAGTEQQGRDEAKPKPGAVPPLTDAAPTRVVDCSGTARTDAEAAGEEKSTGIFYPEELAGSPAKPAGQSDAVTTEVDGRPRAFGPLPPIPSLPKPDGRPVTPPPPPVRASSPPQAPARPKVPVPSRVPPPAAKAGEAQAGAQPEQAPKPEEKAPAAPAPGTAAFVEAVRAAVSEILAPIEARLKTVEALAKDTDEAISALGEDVFGKETAPGEEPRPGFSGLVARVSEELAALKTTLFGEKPEEAIGVFAGTPVIPAMFEQICEDHDHLEVVVGRNGERAEEVGRIVTAKIAQKLVVEMLKKDPDFAKIREAAIESGPDTCKDLLAALSADTEYATEIVGPLYTAPAESLDDPALVQVKAVVIAAVQTVSARARYYYENLDWAKMESEAEEMRKPASESQETGGDE